MAALKPKIAKTDINESKQMGVAQEKTESLASAKPVLKWAGGKTQLIPQLVPIVPNSYGKYIEPFIGGGALFFKLSPKAAVISDSNEELVNLYKVVKTDPKALIKKLSSMKNEEEFFYETRALKREKLDSVTAAARTVYLNRTCFNGLYRVNKKGEFNVPFGRYKNPRICDTEGILSAHQCLQNTEIVLGDYKEVLKTYAKKGDLVFLDPPYLPISQYSDFKRYTKEQFYEEDHYELAAEFERLINLGCYVILTNSNHPLVHQLYSDHKVQVIQTRRNISSDSEKRKGEDVIVVGAPKKAKLKLVTEVKQDQLARFPSTRYMGSKNKLLAHIADVTKEFKSESVLDLFSGSGVVSYMFKTQGKRVISNDYMAMCSTFTKSLIENNSTTLSDSDVHKLLTPAKAGSSNFVAETFQGLYYTDAENKLIDLIRSNINGMRNPYKKALAMSALIRACVKKRPRGIFTYTGFRYDDGRKDLLKTFEEQFIDAVNALNEAVFDNGKENAAFRGDAIACRQKADLVYIDPPYYSPLSDNEYVRRYHFVEGLACGWKDVEIQWHTSTRKFKNYPTPFSTKNGASEAFDKIFAKHRDSVLVVSYSSNSLPSLDEMVAILSRYKKVEVVKVDYTYSFANQSSKVSDNKNKAQEYLFVGY